MKRIDRINKDRNLVLATDSRSLGTKHYASYLILAVIFGSEFFLARKYLNMVFRLDLNFDETEKFLSPLSLDFERGDAFRRASSQGNVSSGLCQPVYFWGGGKSGSTTLWYKLVGGPGGYGNKSIKGPFIDIPGAGKEPCRGEKSWHIWEKAIKNLKLCGGNGNDMRPTHILNGCPRHILVDDAMAFMKLENKSFRQRTTFIMLIRDPIDRLVSHLNDYVRREGRKMNVEKYAKRLAKLSPIDLPEGDLSYQGRALQALLSVVKDPSRVLIIPTESMRMDLQGVFDAIMDHVNGNRFLIDPTHGANANAGNTSNFTYATLSDETTDSLRNEFRQDVLLLENLVGKRFSWSSWAMKLKEEDDIDWLVTVPNPQIEF